MEKMIRYAEVINKLAEKGIKAHVFRKALKSNLIPRHYIGKNTRAFYFWSQVESVLNPKEEANK